jgi:hypothetical protein
LEANLTLPFDVRKQLAILGWLIRDTVFFQHGRIKIDEKWFNDPRAGAVYKAQQKFWKQWGRSPTLDELRSCSAIQAEEPKVRASLLATIESAWAETQNFGLDVIRGELTAWLHARIYREGVERSSQAFNQGRFLEAYSILSERVNEIRTARFDEDLEISFDNPEAWLSESEEQYTDGLTTGLKILDDALVPSGDAKKGGGLFRKDCTIVLAPSNVGKTTTLITMAVHNVIAGKHVLFMTHEGRPSDIREKMLCAFLGMSKPEIFGLYKKPHGIALVAAATEYLKKYMTYIPYNRAGMTVEEVIPIIRRRHEERALLNQGRGYDLLVSDYPAKLSTERARGGHLAKRNLDAVVYDYFVQVALELDFHALLAIQTNRQGSMVNRDDERLLTMEDVLESWDVMAMATNVLTLNRDVRAATNKRMTFYVAKSRSSQTGRAVVARTNFAASLSHSNELGGTWYMGTSTLGDQIDQYLLEYKNQRIPEGSEMASSSAE